MPTAFLSDWRKMRKNGGGERRSGIEEEKEKAKHEGKEEDLEPSKEFGLILLGLLLLNGRLRVDQTPLGATKN